MSAAGFPLAALRAMPAAFEGREALCVTPGGAARVRVFDVRVEGELLAARLEPLATPGLNAAGGSAMDIAAHRSVLHATDSYWAASYVEWQLFFDPQVMARVREIVSVLPAGCTVADDHISRPAPSGSRFASIQTPGPCAAALQSYLRERMHEESTRPMAQGLPL